jgi:hypothetical protein
MQGEGFFAKDVKTGRKRIQKLRNVEAVRGGNANGIDSRIEKLVIVKSQAFRTLRQQSGSHFNGGAIGVGQRIDRDSRNGGEPLRVNPSQRAAPDNSDSDFQSNLLISPDEFVLRAAIPLIPQDSDAQS